MTRTDDELVHYMYIIYTRNTKEDIQKYINFLSMIVNAINNVLNLQE